MLLLDTTTSPQRHGDTEKNTNHLLTRSESGAWVILQRILGCSGFDFLCVSDGTTSHSTKAGKNTSQVAGYVSLWWIVFAFLLTGCGEQKLPSPFKASDVSTKYAQADFHLSDAAGKARSLADYKGKVVVLFFGYTHCPDVCPTTLADMAQVMGMLGKDADKVQVLFVTLDPERDTRDLLAQYVPAFYPTFSGLSGDMQATAAAAQAFGIIFQKVQSKSGSYTLDHSAGTFLIAPGGKPVLLSPFGQRPELLLQDVRLLLAFK
jgi:protein SCO1/2